MTKHMSPEEAYMKLHPWPDYMTALGLSPPSSEEDVEEAYKTKLADLKSQSASPQAIAELEKAYEQAKEFDGLQSSRRKWLSRQVERYVDQELFVAEIEGRGGRVETESIEWIKVSFGDDFAQVADTISSIHLQGKEFADADLAWLAEHSAMLSGLHQLHLANSSITDQGLSSLKSFGALKYLDLENTNISSRGLSVLESLPKLRIIRLGGTRLGKLRRWMLRWKYPDLKIY